MTSTQHRLKQIREFIQDGIELGFSPLFLNRLRRQEQELIRELQEEQASRVRGKALLQAIKTY